MLTREILIDTKGFTDIVDISGHIERFIEENGIVKGLINVAVKGSTASITSLEYEPNMMSDLKRSLEIFAPSDVVYEHAKTWHDDNGVAHVRAAILGSSKSFPVAEGRLYAGTWQQVVLVDFDTRPRSREILLTFVD